MQITSDLDRRFEAVMDGFKPFENAPVFAVALSGGADSTALCLMTQKYAARSSGSVLALIVNHNLRPESGKEAETVADWCRARQIPFEILTVENPPVTHIEENARKLRYQLLSDACKRHHCLYLLTGHHARDMAETVVMRQKRKSTATGLAGIAACESFDFGWLLRPLLSFYPEELRACNRENNAPWVEDETNVSDKFERSKLRKTLSQTDISLALKTAETCADKRRQAESSAENFIGKHLCFDASGVVFFTRDALKESPNTDWLGGVLRFVGQKPYAPNESALKDILACLNRPDFSGASLGGCFFAPLAKDRIYICRESNHIPLEKNVANVTVVSWGIFNFRLSEPFTGKIRALGNEKIPKKVKTALPKRCFQTLPAFFDEEGLFLVPHLGYKRKSVLCETAFAPNCRAGRDIGWIFNKAVK